MPRESMSISESEYAQMLARQKEPKASDVTFATENHPRNRPGYQVLSVDNRGLKPRMNKWEAAFALELEASKRAGQVLWYGFEAIKLRLADATFYTPDFAVVQRDRELRFMEIKGFLRDDAAVKFKVAAEQFPQFHFSMYRKRKGGGWDLIRHLNAA